MKTIKNLSLTTLALFALLLTSGMWSISARQADEVVGPANLGESVGHRMDGKRVFELEQFGGNGRTCVTCHSSETGTVTPAEVRERFAQNPNDPLFRAKDSDHGDGLSYNRLSEFGLFTVKVKTHPNCLPAEDLTAKEVTLFRGTGNTINTAPLDDTLMLDGRANNLEDQALGAVQAHYDNTEEPDSKDLQRLAQFQHTRQFFSSDELYAFDNGGPPPELPTGNTPEEIHGRTFFEPNGMCGRCHGGPMLNMTSEFNRKAGGRFSRFSQVGVNTVGITALPQTAPRRMWRLVNDNTGQVVFRTYHDAGHMLQTGKLTHFGNFRIPSLWNVKNTAPYFHNNAAADLDLLLKHYQQFFNREPDRPGPDGVMDNDELKAIKAYLMLL
jgi:cytochrome c peroxidase